MPRAAPGPAARPRARAPRHAEDAPQHRPLYRRDWHWTGEAGDAREALQLYRELLPDQEHVLGPDHPDTLLTRYDIAHWTGKAGDAQRRCGYASSYSRIGSASRGLITPTRWDALRHRPLDRQGGGRAEALRLCRELLPDQQRVLGADHPETLTTRHSIAHWTGEIAHWTGEARDAREALQLHRELLPDRQRVQGPDHPETLATRRRIAHWTGETGDAREALRLCLELLPDQERVLGPEHPDTLLTRHDIAHWTARAGEV